MSHAARIRTQFQDPRYIARAAEEMGFPASRIEVFDTAQKLNGVFGTFRGEAEIILRRDETISDTNDPNYRYGDIGFQRQPDGSYMLVVEDFDRAYKGVNKSWMDDLQQLYNTVRTEELWSNAGRIHERVYETNGDVAVYAGRGW